MTDAGHQAQDDAAVAAVVRSFTEAEVALREIAGAAADFRSATDSLEASGTRMDTAQASMTEVVGELRSLSATLTATSRSIGTAAEGLARLRPEQLWNSLQAVREEGETISSTLAAGHSQQAGAHGQAQATLMEITDRLAEQAGQVAANERRLADLTSLTVATLVGTLILIVLVVGGMLTGP